WMPRKSLHGRTCGVSRDGGRARALHQVHRPIAPQPIYPHCQARKKQRLKQSRFRTVASLTAIKCPSQKLSSSSARRPHRSRDTP
ncbi:hypothetical protein XarbCFBP8130_20565, partial [Xanthomonas arboricola]